jgi:hypothetical protein
MKKLVLYLSNSTLIIGAAIGIYALINIYLIKSKLPADVCPVVSNRPLLYTSIVLCLISFILSFFEPKFKDRIEGK